MADAIAKQIVDAVLARVAAINGIGEVGSFPKPPSLASGFPAVYLAGDEEEKEPRTHGATGGSKTCRLTVTLVFYTADPDSYSALANLAKSIEDAVEASPYQLGVGEVARAFVVGVKRYAVPPPTTHETGAGELALRVTYSQPYGNA